MRFGFCRCHTGWQNCVFSRYNYPLLCKKWTGLKQEASLWVNGRNGRVLSPKTLVLPAADKNIHQAPSLQMKHQTTLHKGTDVCPTLYTKAIVQAQRCRHTTPVGSFYAQSILWPTARLPGDLYKNES